MKITRRQAIKIAGVAAVSGLGYGAYRLGCEYTDLFVDHLYPYVQPTVLWTSKELSACLGHMRKTEQELILHSLGAPIPFNVDNVKRKVRWLSSNIFTYPLRNKTSYDYHEEILRWLAREYHVEDKFLLKAPSFVLERKILDSLFIQLWDKLSPAEREKILIRIDKEGSIQDKAGIALAGGATALGLLSATVCFTGFAFYTSMSAVICGAASFLGVALPFAAYSGASATVAVLAGPVGWAIFGLAAVGAAAILGRANATKTAAFVTQLHMLKVQSLKNSNRLNRVLAELALK